MNVFGGRPDVMTTLPLLHKPAYGPELRILAAVLITTSFLFWDGCGEGTQGKPSAPSIDVWESQLSPTPPNRAPMAKVEASSSRFGLLPNHGTSLLDLIPTTWPRLVPRFVQDGSLLTRWASAGNECPSLLFDLGNHAQGTVTIGRIALSWELDVPKEFVLELSDDKEAWMPVYQGPGVANAVQEIGLVPVQETRWVRLRSLDCPVLGGISLYEVSVYGPSDTSLPPPISRITLDSISPQTVSLSWGPVEHAYCYRVYRLPASGLPPHPPSHLVTTTDRTEFLDQGLTPSTEYYYRIVPESFSGNLGPSTIVCHASTPYETTDEPPFRIRGVVEGFYNLV